MLNLTLHNTLYFILYNTLYNAGNQWTKLMQTCFKPVPYSAFYIASYTLYPPLYSVLCSVKFSTFYGLETCLLMAWCMLSTECIDEICDQTAFHRKSDQNMLCCFMPMASLDRIPWWIQNNNSNWLVLHHKNKLPRLLAFEKPRRKFISLAIHFCITQLLQQYWHILLKSSTNLTEILW